MSDVDRWEEHYQGEEPPPWDSGEVEPLFVQAVEAGLLPKGRLLDLGCGTGTNARYFASLGYEVVGVDFAPTAIAAAQKQPMEKLRFEQLDVLRDALPAGPFDVVVDRGCWHVFDAHVDRKHLAQQVAGVLREGGCFLSLMGSTEGPARELGPPRRNAIDIATAIEPALQIVELRRVTFSGLEEPVEAWLCLARRRDVDAQPSTVRD